MTKVLEDAIEKVRKLPEDRGKPMSRKCWSRLLAAGSDPVHCARDPSRRRAFEGLRRGRAREFASDEEMADLWKKVWPVRLRYPRARALISRKSTNILQQHSPGARQPPSRLKYCANEPPAGAIPRLQRRDISVFG